MILLVVAGITQDLDRAVIQKWLGGGQLLYPYDVPHPVPLVKQTGSLINTPTAIRVELEPMSAANLHYFAIGRRRFNAERIIDPRNTICSYREPITLFH